MEGAPKRKEEFPGLEKLAKEFKTLPPEAEKDMRPRAVRYILSLDPLQNRTDLKALTYAINKKGGDLNFFATPVDPSYSREVEQLFEAVLDAKEERDKIAAAELLVTRMQHMQDEFDQRGS